MPTTPQINVARIKYLTSVDRNILINNLAILNNEENYRDLYYSWWDVSREGINPFRPIHDVFGGQTGIESSDTGDVFREAYNKAIDRYYVFTRTEQDTWLKDWGKIIPKTGDGTYRVKEVGQWLWNRYIADGLKNFGTLEKAHVFALIGSGRDLGYFINENDPLHVYTEEELETTPAFVDMLNDLEIAIVCLDTSAICTQDDKKTANFRVGMAINFITATPYMFAQEGR